MRDDGRGGADRGRGIGLRGLADRVAALDGRFTVASPPGERDHAASGAAMRDRDRRGLASCCARGAVRLLEDAGFDVVGEAGDGEDLLRKVRAHRPDVAVVDIRMPPDARSTRACRRRGSIREELPDVGVLMLSQYVEERYVDASCSSTAPRASATCSRTASPRSTRFTDAVRAGRPSGGSVLDPEVVAHMLGRPPPRPPLDALTAREREVLGADGRGPDEPRRSPRRCSSPSARSSAT